MSSSSAWCRSSLALAHLLAGFATLVRNAPRVRFHALHALWMWIAFATTVGNWGSYWKLRTLLAWPAWADLSRVALAVGQYVFCAFVSPVAPGEVDLAGFHARERRRYITLFVVLYGFAIAYNFAAGRAGYYPDWIRDSAVCIAGVTLGLLALLVRVRWVQYVSASALAAMVTYFMVVACNIGAAWWPVALRSVRRPFGALHLALSLRMNADNNSLKAKPARGLFGRISRCAG